MFDSGVGGLTVARSVLDQLPHEQVLYIGDTANSPYGPRDIAEVRSLALGIMDELVDRGVKLLVIACNTATSAAVNALRDHYDIPIIGMEPALKVACDRGDTAAGDGTAPARHMPQHVIVAATPLTLREHKFAALMDRFKANNMISPQPCPDLVEIAESGRLCDHDLVMRTLHRYFDGYDLPSIDSVVLGCTHFVFYRDYFRELLPSTTAIIDGNRGTVRHLGMVLESLGKLAPEEMDGGVEIANSDSGERIAALSRELLHS